MWHFRDSCSTVGVGRVDSRFHGNDGGMIRGETGGMIRGNDRGIPGGVGRVDSRFHGNDGGRTGIPAPWSGLDAWIPVFTGMTGHSWVGVGRVDSRFHGNDGGGLDAWIPAPWSGLDAWIPVFTGMTGGGGRTGIPAPRAGYDVDSPPHPVIPATPVGVGRLWIPVKTGIHAIGWIPVIPATSHPVIPAPRSGLDAWIPVIHGNDARGGPFPLRSAHRGWTLVIPVFTGIHGGGIRAATRAFLLKHDEDGVGRVDSRFHGNDADVEGGGRTGIPAPRSGLDAWIPVFTGMTGGGRAFLLSRSGLDAWIPVFTGMTGGGRAFLLHGRGWTRGFPFSRE